jgi:hypothetical protein
MNPLDNMRAQALQARMGQMGNPQNQQQVAPQGYNPQYNPNLLQKLLAQMPNHPNAPQNKDMQQQMMGMPQPQQGGQSMPLPPIDMYRRALQTGSQRAYGF